MLTCSSSNRYEFFTVNACVARVLYYNTRPLAGNVVETAMEIARVPTRMFLVDGI